MNYEDYVKIKELRVIDDLTFKTVCSITKSKPFLKNNKEMI